jgi:hypothetical protein
MDILSTLSRAKSLLLQGQYQGAENLIDRAISEIEGQQERDKSSAPNPAASGRHETCSKNHLGVIFPK